MLSLYFCIFLQDLFFFHTPSFILSLLSYYLTFFYSLPRTLWMLTWFEKHSHLKGIDKLELVSCEHFVMWCLRSRHRVTGGSAESLRCGFAPSSCLGSQIKITVISPEAGLSCHSVRETVIWLVMTQPKSHYIFDGRLEQKNRFVCLCWSRLRGGGLQKAICCEFAVIRFTLHICWGYIWEWLWFVISPNVNFKLLKLE